MTSITDREKPILYPVTYKTRPRCFACWRDLPDLALVIDPRTDELEPLCRGCARALNDGQPIPEPSHEELAESWQWLARQHQNHRGGEETGITDEVIDLALAALTPAWMPPQAGWQRFEELKEMLLAHQEADAGGIDPASLEPDWRDPETYANHCRGLVDDAVHKLIGRTA